MWNFHLGCIFQQDPYFWIQTTQSKSRFPSIIQTLYSTAQKLVTTLLRDENLVLQYKTLISRVETLVSQDKSLVLREPQKTESATAWISWET